MWRYDEGEVFKKYKWLRDNDKHFPNNYLGREADRENWRLMRGNVFYTPPQHRSLNLATWFQEYHHQARLT